MHGRILPLFGVVVGRGCTHGRWKALPVCDERMHSAPGRKRFRLMSGERADVKGMQRGTLYRNCYSSVWLYVSRKAIHNPNIVSAYGPQIVVIAHRKLGQRVASEELLVIFMAPEPESYVSTTRSLNLHVVGS